MIIEHYVLRYIVMCRVGDVRDKGSPGPRAPRLVAPPARAAIPVVSWRCGDARRAERCRACAVGAASRLCLLARGLLECRCGRRWGPGGLGPGRTAGHAEQP